MRSEALTLGGATDAVVAVATEVAARSRVRLVHAFGEARTVDDWARLAGVSARTMRYRLARGHAPEVAITLPCDVRHVNPEVTCGSPNSWTWECLPFEDDAWARRFVQENRGGASLEAIGVAWGVRGEHVRQIEERAIEKLADAILASGDPSLVQWLAELSEAARGQEEP